MSTENILLEKKAQLTFKTNILEKPTRKFEFNLEALRGFAALFVVFGHIFKAKDSIDSNYFPEGLENFITPASLSVLVFFVLSGFVIGLTSKKQLKGKEIVFYLKKRLVRLYPIYLISLVLALLVATKTYSVKILISNFSFTQILFSEVIKENGPIWSLHYEVLYYLLFIPISYFRINPILVAIASIIIGVVNYYLYPITDTAVISSYAFGFAFWSTGLIIAKYFQDDRLKVNYNLLLSNIFLFLCLEKFNVLSPALGILSDTLLGHSFDFPNSIPWVEKVVSFQSLTLIPYCTIFILSFTDKAFKVRNQLFWLLQLLPALTFVYLYKFASSTDLSLYYVPAIYYCISLVLFIVENDFLNKLSKKVIFIGVWVGSISYGIYIIHFPIIFLFKRITLFSGSPLTFTVRLCLFMIITLGMAYLLEKKFQPYFKKLM